MGPLRKNKPSSLATHRPQPINPAQSPESYVPNVEPMRQDPGVELLQSFQQQASPLSINHMTMPASPPETTWYAGPPHEQGLPPMPPMIGMQANTTSIPYHTLPASAPQVIAGFPQQIQINTFHDTHQHSASMHSSLNSAASNGSFPSTNSSSTYAGDPNMNSGYDSARTSRTSITSAEMPALGQSNAMWESGTGIDLSLQEMLNQPQLPSSVAGSITDPAELDDQFWSSSLFDFSGLFPTESWNANPEFMRNSSPSAPDATPAEKLSEIWPTRPSRRKLGCCTPGYINCELPPDVAAGTSRKIDTTVANRMYRHLENGAVAFKKSLPTVAVLNDLIEKYFQYWHPNWPMLHYPTFDPSRTSALVLLNMVALGALFVKTPDGPELADAIMEKMHEALSFCMSAQLSLFFDEYDRDVLALCQAYMMRQLFWLTAGDRNMLESTQLLHSTVANVARRAGMFSADSCELPEGMTSLEREWRQWVGCEVRRRTALCFCINDLTFATFFMTPPYATVGSVSWSLPENDALFAAKTAEEWHQKRLNAKPRSAPLHDLAASLFTSQPDTVFRNHSQSSFSTHILVSSIFSIVLATRVNRPDLDKELSKDCKSQAPLANSLAAALRALTAGKPDPFGSRVTWDLSWLHLLADIKLMEVLCGREGSEAAEQASGQAGAWASTSRARRAVLHAVSILETATSMGLGGREVPPLVYIALFQSWMVTRIFTRCSPSAFGTIPRGVDWPSLGACGLGALSAGADDSDVVQWIRSGEEIHSNSRLDEIVPEFQSTLCSLGHTKLRTMLSDLMAKVEDSQTTCPGLAMLSQVKSHSPSD